MAATGRAWQGSTMTKRSKSIDKNRTNSSSTASPDLADPCRAHSLRSSPARCAESAIRTPPACLVASRVCRLTRGGRATGRAGGRPASLWTFRNLARPDQADLRILPGTWPRFPVDCGPQVRPAPLFHRSCRAVFACLPGWRRSCQTDLVLQFQGAEVFPSAVSPM